MRFSLHYSRRYRVSCRTLKRTLERRHSTWAPMQYTRLGSTGLQISRICLGTMSFGNSEEWMVELEKAKPIVKRAVDLGMNFFDTANLYSNGRSEEIVGELLKGHRDDVVIATKVRLKVGEGPNKEGLSRHHILQQVRKSLKRLQTDRIDLYQIHRWDYGTTIEETLLTLNDLVRQGTVGYIGASSMWAWQFAKALFTSDHFGIARFVSMQNHYNLCYREEEREMIPLCKDQGIGLIPWSPLARGFSGIHDLLLVAAEVTWYGDSSCCALAEGVRVKTQVVSLRKELKLMSLERLGTNNIVKPVLSNEEETTHRIPLNIRPRLPFFYRLSIEFNVNSHRFCV